MCFTMSLKWVAVKCFTSIYRGNQNCTIQLIKKATKNVNLRFREPAPMLRMTDVIL